MIIILRFLESPFWFLLICSIGIAELDNRTRNCNKFYIFYHFIYVLNVWRKQDFLEKNIQPLTDFHISFFLILQHLSIFDYISSCISFWSFNTTVARCLVLQAEKTFSPYSSVIYKRLDKLNCTTKILSRHPALTRRTQKANTFVRCVLHPALFYWVCFSIAQSLCNWVR